jgi:hypothetical protein
MSMQKHIMAFLCLLFFLNPILAQNSENSTDTSVYMLEKNTPFSYSYHLEIKWDSTSKPYFEMLNYEFKDLPTDQSVLEVAKKFDVNPYQIASCISAFKKWRKEGKNYNDTLIQRLKLLASKTFEKGYGIVMVVGGNGDCRRGSEALGTATHKFGFEYICVSSDCESYDIKIGATAFNETAYSILAQKHGPNWQDKLEKEIERFNIERASILPPKPYENYTDLLINKYQTVLLANHFRQFINLETLIINDDCDELPIQLGELKLLKSLSIGYGQSYFTKIPNSICLLDSLEVLYLPHGKLKVLPKELGKLKALKTLDVRENELTELPESICDLINLEDLYIQNNEITKLPKNIGNLKKLKRLMVDMEKLSSSEKERLKSIFGDRIN